MSYSNGAAFAYDGAAFAYDGAAFAYDDLGRLVSYDPVAPTLATQAYDFDAWGNITNAWGNITKKGAVELEYPDATVAGNGPHKTNQVKVGGSFYDPQHDANGNRKLTFANGEVTGQAIYDREDRLAAIALGGGESVSFVYDAGGQQKIKIYDDGVGEHVTKYYGPQIEVRPDGSAIKSYFFGGTRVASVVESDSSWQLDHLAAGAWESGVEFATQWGGAPVLLVTVSQGAVTAGGWATALFAVGLFLLPAGRRRRAVVGLRLGRGPAILVAIVVFTGTMPWPLLIQPAQAQPQSPAPQDVSNFHYDHLGSPLLITDGAGQVVEHIRYDPYGAVRGRYNGAGNPIGEPLATDVRYEFTGYEAERNSGLLYANARFYDTELGSFLTHDPMAEFWSPYSYVGWDPANRTDPTGMDFGISTLIIAFIVGFAASAISAGIQGASFGDALLAGLIGGASAVVGATIGAAVLQPALEGLLGGVASAIGTTGKELATNVLFVSGIGQASYGASQGDYSGLIGFGLGLALGNILAEGAEASEARRGGINGVKNRAVGAGHTLESNAQFDSKYNPRQNGHKILHAGASHAGVNELGAYITGTSEGIGGYIGKLLAAPVVGLAGGIYEIQMGFFPPGNWGGSLDGLQSLPDWLFDSGFDILANSYGIAVSLVPGISGNTQTSLLNLAGYIPGPDQTVGGGRGWEGAGFFRFSRPNIGY